MSLTKEDLKVLSEPFDEKTIGVKVQSLSRDKSRAMLVCYVQHTDVYSRIEQVDPSWLEEVTNATVMGESCFVRVKLTIKGVSRENAGEGGDYKAATSDAIKRAAMLFGVGRYLYDSETVWVPYNESSDRFRIFTLADYKAALKPPTPDPSNKKTQAGPPVGPKPNTAPAGGNFGAPKPAPKKTNAQLGAEILANGRKLGMSESDTLAWAQECSGSSPEEMTNEQLVSFLEVTYHELGRKGESA